MIKDTSTFTTLSDMIKHLSCLPNVVGIVEYGNRSHTDMTPGGDYDLTVIFDKPVSKNFSGVHFHVGGIPVDCMLLSVDDFLLPEPADKFHLIHLNCTILYDKDGTTKKLLESIKSKWHKPHNISDNRKMWIRFIAKHMIDKLEHRLYDDELYSRAFIAPIVGYAIDVYSQTKGLEPGKWKADLAHMKQHDPDLYGYIEALLNTTDLELQFEMYKKINTHLAEDFGGMWKEGETLFHLSYDGVNDKKEQEAFSKFLFGDRISD